MSNNIVRLPEVKKKYYNTSANKFKLFKSKTKVERPPVLKLSDINLVPVSNQNKIISDFKAYNSYIKNDGQHGYNCHPQHKSTLFVQTAGPNEENKFTVSDYEVFTCM